MTKTSETENRFNSLLGVLKSSTKAAKDASLELSQMAIQQFADHGNLTFANIFVKDLDNKFLRVGAFVLWMKAFSPVVVEGSITAGYSFKKDTVNAEKPSDNENGVVCDLEGAFEQSFWEFSKPEEEVKEYDYNEPIKVAMAALGRLHSKKFRAKDDPAILMLSRTEKVLTDLKNDEAVAVIQRKQERELAKIAAENTGSKAAVA